MCEVKHPNVSVVVPTYNERDNIEELITRIDRALSSAKIPYEVVVVDDNSPDGTAEVASRLSTRYPVKVIKRPGKLGLSSAVIEGVRNSAADVIAVMDADLQHPPELIPRLYQRLAQGGCDIVVASRYVRGGEVRGWSVFRRLVSRAATMLARVLVPQARKVNDPLSGYFMFKKDAIGGLNHINPRGFKILLEILAKGRYRRVCEEPYSFGLRVRGSSKLSSKVMWDFVVQTLNLSPDYLKFAIVGASGTLVNLGVVALCRYVLGLLHEVASALGIEVSVINNFVLNDLWTFRTRRRGPWPLRLAKFHLSTLASILVQYATSIAAFHYVIHESVTSQFLGIVAGFIVNYTVSRRFVWR